MSLTGSHFGFPGCCKGLALVLALAGPITLSRISSAQTALIDREAMGDSLYSEFMNVKALDEYRAALGNRPTDFNLMFKTARTANDVAQDAQASGDRDEAERFFEEAVSFSHRLTEVYPDSAASWFMLAATTGKMAQFRGGKEKVRIGRDVEQYYKHSITLDSTYALAYLVGGIFNREVASLNWIQRLAANTLFGGLPDASLEQSKRLLGRAIELQKDLLIAHWEFGQTCLAMGRRDEALVHFRYISTLEPHNTEDRRLKSKAAEMLMEDHND